MAVVTSDLLFLTFAGLKTTFDTAYLKASEAAMYQQVATELPTTLPTQKYGWLGRGATMEVFRDRVRQQPVYGYSYSLSDTIYKGNLTIERKMLEDDQYGELIRRVQELGAEPTRHKNQKCFQALTSGFTALGYDGLTFFSSSHQEGASPTQSNTSSSPLSDAALEVADTTMRGIQDDKGVPMEINPDTLVVGPKLARRAFDLTGSTVAVVKVGDGTAGTGATAATPFVNYFGGRYKLVVNWYITNYNWFLLDTSRSVKPIILQTRSDVPISVETDMTDGASMIRDEYQFSVRGRYEVGYGPWQMAFGSSASS